MGLENSITIPLTVQLRGALNLLRYTGFFLTIHSNKTRSFTACIVSTANFGDAVGQTVLWWRILESQ